MTAVLASCDIHPAAFYEADKQSDPSAGGAMFVEAERREDKELKGHTQTNVSRSLFTIRLMTRRRAVQRSVVSSPEDQEDG